MKNVRVEHMIMNASKDMRGTLLKNQLQTIPHFLGRDKIYNIISNLERTKQLSFNVQSEFNIFCTRIIYNWKKKKKIELTNSFKSLE